MDGKNFAVGQQHPHDEPRYRNRCFHDVVVCRRSEHAENRKLFGYVDHVDRPYHLQFALRYAFGAAKVPSNGQAPHRGGVGSGMHPRADLFPCGASLHFARNAFGLDDELSAREALAESVVCITCEF